MMQAPKRFFPLPNEIFGLELSTGELSVYSYLMFLESRRTFRCWPSYSTIGRAIGKSKNSVKKYVDGLIDKHLISVEPTRICTQGGQVRNGNLMYTILPISEAVEINHARRLAAMNAERVRQEAMQRIEDYNRKNLDNPVTVTDNRQARSVSAL